MPARLQEFKVGLLVVLAVLALIGIAIFFRALGLGGGYLLRVEFDRVDGLMEGTDVLINGVRKGAVERILLTQEGKVGVVLRMERDAPVFSRSKVKVKTSPLTGKAQVCIYNPIGGKVGSDLRKAMVRGVVPKRLTGEPPVDWEEVIPELRDGVREIRQLAKSANQVLGDKELRLAAKETVTNLAVSSQQLRELVTDPQMVGSLRRTAFQLDRATNSLAQLTGDPKFRVHLTATLRRVDAVTRQLQAITSDKRLTEGLPKTVENLQQVTNSVRAVVSDPQFNRSVRSLLVNLDAATSRLKELTEDKELFSNLKQVVANLQTATSQIAELTSDEELKGSLKRTVQEVEKLAGTGTEAMEQLEATLSDARKTIEEMRSDMDATLETLKGIGQDLKDTTEAIRWLAAEAGLKENIAQAVKNIKDSSDNMKAASDSLKELMTDPELSGSLKRTIKGAEEVTASAKELTEQGKQVVQKARQPLEELTALRLHPHFSFWTLPEKDSTFGDFNLTLRSRRSPGFYNLGVHDVSQGERLNLQVGRWLDRRFGFRLGLYRGELGLGLDWRSKFGQLSLDGYNPNDPKYNAWLKLRVLPQLRLLIGGEDLSGERLLGLGLEY